MEKILLTIVGVMASMFSANAQCFVQIASGEQHTVAIADDGTLWGWGSNTSGECGVLPNQNLLVPTQIGAFSDWVDVDCGPYHTIALRTNGDVYTMGYNNNGQCGNGNTSNLTTPTMVASGFIKVAAGKGYTSYGIKSDSTLWATGLNLGRFGNGTTNPSQVFILVDSTHKWVEIAGGLNHSIGLTDNGEVYTSGTNLSCELGQGLNNYTSTNTRLLVNTNGHNIVDVDAGSFFSMMLNDLGQVFTFGSNAKGRLGMGNQGVTNYGLPYLISGFGTDQITKIKAGYNGIIAISDTAIYSWGKNDYNITSLIANNRYSPYRWNLTKQPVDASMGLFNSAFISLNEGVYNWGANDRGNCGNGTSAHQYSPVINNATCFGTCAITDVTIDSVSACDPASNSYTVTIITTYMHSGPADSLHIGGFGMPTVTFFVTGSPQTETVMVDFDETTSSATNLSVSLWSSTNIDFTCIHPVIGGAWTAPLPCGTMGIKNLPQTTPILYPNPTNSLLHIELKEATQIRIVNVLGKTVTSHQLKAGINTLDVSALVCRCIFSTNRQWSYFKICEGVRGLIIIEVRSYL